MKNLMTGTARLSASGPASAETAWERYAQPRLWSTWSPQIRGVETDDRLHDGATGTVHGPVGVRVHFVVTEFDEPAKRWSWTARLGPIRLDLAHAVLPDGDTGSRTTLQVDGPWPIVAGYLPLARLALHRLVN